MRLINRHFRWLDGGVPVDALPVTSSLRIEWRRNLGFFAIHLLCVLVLSWLGLVKDLKKLPAAVRDSHRTSSEARSAR